MANEHSLKREMCSSVHTKFVYQGRDTLCCICSVVFLAQLVICLEHRQ